MLQWVYEAATSCGHFDHVEFAVDASVTKKLCESFGATAVMTSKDCTSGTKRLIEYREKSGVDADVWVNWQADEPFVTAEMIGELLSGDQSDVWTLMRRIDATEDPNLVKVVTDQFGYALYFSRASIPHGAKKCFQHIGLYAFSNSALDKIATLDMSLLEEIERLEQLTFLAGGLKIQVLETKGACHGIDTPEDLIKSLQLGILSDYGYTDQSKADFQLPASTSKA